MNINERKQEAKQQYLKLVELNEDVIDPAEWGKNFPREYDGYKRTAENTSRRHGGSEALSKLDEDPRLTRIFAGYPFSVDYREHRGHAFMLEDQDNTERVKQFKQPGACLHCHASIIPAYRKEGGGDVMKGFELVCAMPLKDARQLVSHPVSCIDCHDPQSMQLRVTRPAFINGIKELAKHVAGELAKEEGKSRKSANPPPLPQLTSIHQWAQHWNKGDRKEEYDVNALATRQELRSFVCGQCHVEYYFKGNQKVVTYPWHNGLRVEEMESYYDEQKFTDYVHGETGAPILKAQHPEFELWNQGIHARSGVACADCHMPYQREGAVKISDHQVRSPLLNVAQRLSDLPSLPGGRDQGPRGSDSGPEQGVDGPGRRRPGGLAGRSEGGEAGQRQCRGDTRSAGADSASAMAGRFHQRGELDGFPRPPGISPCLG